MSRRPRPRYRGVCAICDNTNETTQICRKCRRDPVNAGWVESWEDSDEGMAARAAGVGLSSVGDKKLRDESDLKRKILDMATRGVYEPVPWNAPTQPESIVNVWSSVSNIAHEVTGPDAALIAAARTAVPELIAEVRRLRGSSTDPFAFYDPSIEQELGETGRVKDCDHVRCHSPMGDGHGCLRHELAYAQHTAAEEKTEAAQWYMRWQARDTETQKLKAVVDRLVDGMPHTPGCPDAYSVSTRLCGCAAGRLIRDTVASLPK